MGCNCCKYSDDELISNEGSPTIDSDQEELLRPHFPIYGTVRSNDIENTYPNRSTNGVPISYSDHSINDYHSSSSDILCSNDEEGSNQSLNTASFYDWKKKSRSFPSLPEEVAWYNSSDTSYNEALKNLATSKSSKDLSRSHSAQPSGKTDSYYNGETSYNQASKGGPIFNSRKGLSDYYLARLEGRILHTISDEDAFNPIRVRALNNKSKLQNDRDALFEKAEKNTQDVKGDECKSKSQKDRDELFKKSGKNKDFGSSYSSSSSRKPVSNSTNANTRNRSQHPEKNISYNYLDRSSNPSFLRGATSSANNELTRSPVSHSSEILNYPHSSSSQSFLRGATSNANNEPARSPVSHPSDISYNYSRSSPVSSFFRGATSNANNDLPRCSVYQQSDNDARTALSSSNRGQVSDSNSIKTRNRSHYAGKNISPNYLDSSSAPSFDRGATSNANNELQRSSLSHTTDISYNSPYSSSVQSFLRGLSSNANNELPRTPVSPLSASNTYGNEEAVCNPELNTGSVSNTEEEIRTHQLSELSANLGIDVQTADKSKLLEILIKRMKCDDKELSQPHSSNTTAPTKHSGHGLHRSKSNDGLKSGYCYIFSCQKFKDQSPIRPGSEKDVIRLKHTFEWLNFEVYSDFVDLTKTQTLKVLKDAAMKDHKNSEYFACCFLTHGKNGSLLVNDGYIKVDDILKCFSRSACKTLAGKPKIFIFQACRDRSCGVEISDSESRKEVRDYLDFLFLYTTYEGRGKEDMHGSFFIDELCRTLEQFSGDSDLLQILTILNHRVAQFGLSHTEDRETERRKDFPGFTSKLTNLVKFSKFNTEIPLFLSEDSKYFNNRRRKSSLDSSSIDSPMQDKKIRQIESKRVKFLILLNMKHNLDIVSKFFATLTRGDYRSATLSNWTEDTLMDYLQEVKNQNLTNVDALICFVVCKAKGDYLIDLKGTEFQKKKIAEQFSGKECPKLRGKPKIFIFLMSAPNQDTWRSCVFPDSDDGSFIPLYSDFLEVTITIRELKQLTGAISEFSGIFGSERSGDFLTQLTKMNRELVTHYGFHSTSNNSYYSLNPFQWNLQRFSSSDSNLATFCLNSTLTETIILNSNQFINSKSK